MEEVFKKNEARSMTIIGICVESSTFGIWFQYDQNVCNWNTRAYA